jgi:cysteine-rich repeat protein
MALLRRFRAPLWIAAFSLGGTAGCGLLAGSDDFRTDCPPGTVATADLRCVDGCGKGKLLLPDGSCVASVCGDGRVDETNGEECEPGMLGCGGNCRWSSNVCGDGRVTGDEQCEPPNNGACDATCHITACGDHKITGDEECDPPDGTSCDDQCKKIPGIACGDKVVSSAEQCDDGGTDRLDGCDAECRFETVFRLDSFTAQAGSAPSWCAVQDNAFGKYFAGWFLALKLIMGGGIEVGVAHPLLQLSGLHDLTGTQKEQIELGYLSGIPDPKAGAWPVVFPGSPNPPASPVDWPFLVDSSAIDADRVALLRASTTVENRALQTAASDARFQLGNPFIHFDFDLVQAQMRAALGAATKVANSQLEAVEQLDATGPNRGICGGVTVESLARIPLMQGLIGACAPMASGSSAYKTCQNKVGEGCNSLLDLLIGGCTAAGLPPLPPDIVAPSSPALTPDPVSNKVPAAQTDGNHSAYSAWFGLSGVRESLSGVHQVPPPTCDSTKSPHDDPCVIDEAFGVFVDPDAGDDLNAGTRASPLKTLSGALPLAINTGKRVYICQGTIVGFGGPTAYLDSSASGIQIFGGLSCSDWSYKGDSTVLSGGPEALVIKNAAQVRIEDVELRGDALGAGGGGNSYGTGTDSIAVRVEQSQNVEFHRVKFTAKAATAGLDGDVIATFVGPANAGAPGNSGVAACSSNPTPGGNGGQTFCNPIFSPPPLAPGNGGLGGDGASGSASGGDGLGGEPLSSSGLGGVGDDGSSTWSCAISAGQDGAPGVAGAPGPGAAGAAVRPLPNDPPDLVMVLPLASAGDPGKPGQGGGGGGGAKAAAGALVCSALGINVGASAGGGGGGGCAGEGGRPGGAGGSSIGLVSISSSIQLFDCEMKTGLGGHGGKGAAGQAGGAGGLGGQPGQGSSGSSSACGGGKGGDGGAGGPGGGGSGGFSIGVLWVGTPPANWQTTPITLGSQAAAGGLDGAGSNANAGMSGLVQNGLELQQ